MATNKESNKREDQKARSYSAKADLIRTIERERLRALVEADMDIAHQLHADDFQLINPLEVRIQKSSISVALLPANLTSLCGNLRQLKYGCTMR